MEVLLVLLLAAVFVGPTAYHLYERYKRPQQSRPPRQGPSYLRRMLGMLTPVFILAFALVVVTIGLYFLGPH